MKTNNIKILLERYYNGETTQQEEQQIKEFFATGDVPEEMLADKRMFDELSSAGEPEVPSYLDDKISRTIDAEAKKHRTVRLRLLGGVAAMLCIIFSLNAFLSRQEAVPTAKDTCKTPEEAAIQTQRAILAFSDALKKGSVGIDKAEKTTEEVNKKLIEHLKNLK